MSRDIEFRAWEEMTEMGKPGSMSYNQDFCLSQIRHPDGIILMQYTGLRDCHRVKIWESDIIKLSYGIPPTHDTLLIEYADGEEVADITVSGWWMRNIRANGCSGSLSSVYEYDIEVIGNKWQNGELLEQGVE